MSVDIYGDWLQATRDITLTPESELISLATANSYIFDIIFKDTDVKKMMRGGSEIVEKLQYDEAGNFGVYTPGDTFQPRLKDVVIKAKYPWAFVASHYSLIAEMEALNEGDDNRYFDTKMSAEQACAIGTVNGMERLAFAKPNYEKMEDPTLQSDDDRVPHSILSFVTRDGLPPSSTNGGVASGSSDWTTIGRINPTTYTGWKSKFKSYSQANPTDLQTGVWNSFNSLARQTNFELPSELRRWSTDPKKRRNIIATNEDGANLYDIVLQSMNDRSMMFTDPAINGPQYRGVPVKYIAELDNAGWTSGSPDYLFLNFNYLRPFFKTGWFMKNIVKDGGATQPTTTTYFKFSMCNWACNDIRRLGRAYAA